MEFGIQGGGSPEIRRHPTRPEVPFQVPHDHETERGEDEPEIVERGDPSTRINPGAHKPDIEGEFVPDLHEEVIEDPKKERQKRKKKPQLPHKEKQKKDRTQLH